MTLARLLSEMRLWWRWRMRRTEVHIYGIAEYRATGTVVGGDSSGWHIEDENGRVFCAVAQPGDPDVSIGARVEIEPRFQGFTVRTDWWPAWVIVRKL